MREARQVVTRVYATKSGTQTVQSRLYGTALRDTRYWHTVFSLHNYIIARNWQNSFKLQYSISAKERHTISTLQSSISARDWYIRQQNLICARGWHTMIKLRGNNIARDWQISSNCMAAFAQKTGKTSSNAHRMLPWQSWRHAPYGHVAPGLKGEAGQGQQHRYHWYSY